VSNPLMKSSPNAGGWLEGNAGNSANQPPVVSKDLQQLYGMYQAAKDPKAFMQQVMSANPALEAISHKGSMKDQFYAECQRRGVDPDAFLAQVEQGLKNR
jgi:hypothetical protein